MNRESYWEKLAAKNPRLLRDPHFTSEGARSFFERVWDQAFLEGSRSRENGVSDRLWEKMFGKQ